MNYINFMNSIRIFSLIFLSTLSSLAIGKSTFENLVNGTKCTMNRNQLDCDYTIGEDFWLSIAGVGGVDASISLMKSDFKGKYYGSVGVMHGCVIVKNGLASNKSNIGGMAFVSPKNGKVYQDWPSCQKAK